MMIRLFDIVIKSGIISNNKGSKMSKKVILVVKEPKNHGSVPAERWAQKLGDWVDNVYGPGLDKEVYVMKKGQYTLGPKGMEDIITLYGTDIIVALEWTSRLCNNEEDFDYFYNLVMKDGIEFCFSYDKFIWNKNTGLDDVAKNIEQAQLISQEKSALSKLYSKPRQKKEPANE
jgi:hypothetical protein